MEGFNIVDAAVAAIVLLSAILAYGRGFTREVLAIAGWVGAAVIGYIFAPQLRPMIAQVPVLDTFVADNCDLGMIAAFVAIFAVALLVFAIFTPLFASAIQRSAMSGIDQVLGFLFGVARGAVLVAIAFVVYERALADQAFPMVDASRSASVFADVETRLSADLPQDIPGWFETQYETLMANCPNQPAPAPQAAPADGTTAPADGTTPAPADGATTPNP